MRKTNTKIICCLLLTFRDVSQKIDQVFEQNQVISLSFQSRYFPNTSLLGSVMARVVLDQNLEIIYEAVPFHFTWI